MNPDEENPDLTTALEDISSELFAPEEKKPEEDLVEETLQPEEETGDKTEETGEKTDNSEDVQALGAPKTWTKEALTEWATIPRRAQEEILKREEDIFRGIEQYKEKAEIGQRYDAVMEPYRPILTAEQIDPVEIVRSFAANHYLLSRGTPEQKIQLAANLLTGYQIDVPALLEHMGSAVLNPPDPEIVALRKELSDIKTAQSQFQQQQSAASYQQVQAEVEAFASDPAHPYFDELIDDIDKFFKAGASSLQDAYDKAVYANPVTRQKEIDRLTAEAIAVRETDEKTRKDKIAKSTAADLSASPSSRSGTMPRGSMDDTLLETLAAIESRS